MRHLYISLLLWLDPVVGCFSCFCGDDRIVNGVLPVSFSGIVCNLGNFCPKAHAREQFVFCCRGQWDWRGIVKVSSLFRKHPPLEMLAIKRWKQGYYIVVFIFGFKAGCWWYGVHQR